jgi:DNA repair protein RecN (Recombination protein N)
MHEDHRIDPLKSGLNTFRLLARTNPGTPTGPMNQIASGGELSRIMLAIKTAIASITGTPVLIFDEIDTGISGETALKVGNVMLQLSETTQIFSITHLPQIAAKGQHHYLLFKERDKGLTASDIRKLNHTERIQAIANMIGGGNPGKAALDHAADLLKG